MANVNITIPISNNYFTTSGTTAGLYDIVNGNVTTIVQSENGCCMKLEVPCNFILDVDPITQNVTGGECNFSLCDLKNIWESSAASQLLSASQATALDPALTTPQKQALTIEAKEPFDL